MPDPMDSYDKEVDALFQPITDGDVRRFKEANLVGFGNDLGPCQPIGCDAGIHVPGCRYEDIDNDTGVDL